MAVLKFDPTRTTSLRRRFMKDMARRFRRVKASVKELLVVLDAFGLSDEQPTLLAAGVPRGAYRFQTNEQKLASFRAWLQDQVDQEILTTTGVTGAPWTHAYVDSAYRKGTVRAFTDVRKEALAEKLDFFEGSREQFLRQAFSQPERLSKVRVLAARAFEELRGVTSTMAQQMNRVLADGLVRGQNPRQIARVMAGQIDKLTKTRALTIARTEIIYAHAEGQLDAFEDLGVKKVGILAEWSTAGDDRVCPDCGSREGFVFPIDDARGEIPLHPNCRCAWIPNVG